MKTRTLWMMCLWLVWASVAMAQDPPNRANVVTYVAAQTGDLIKTNTTVFTDMVCATLTRGVTLPDGTVVPPDAKWGRKARADGDWASRNPDALAYSWSASDTGNKALVDVVYSSDSPNAEPSWQPYGGGNPGNGYWMACTSTTPPPDPPDPDPPDPPTDACCASLTEKVNLLVAQNAALTQKVEALSATLTGMEAKLDTLLQQVGVLAARPWPDYTGRIPMFGGTTTLKPVTK